MARTGAGSSGTHVHPPFAAPRTLGRGVPSIREGAADPPAEDDYPAIERFLDELPSIEDYLADAGDPDQPAASPMATDNPVGQGSTRDLDDEGWAVSEWQSYDWSRLSLLGRRSREGAEAEASWTSTDWAQGNAAGQGRPGFADEPRAESLGALNAAEVAAVLDDIARRIRSGELPVDHFRGTPPEAAMAAALAALLRMRG